MNITARSRSLETDLFGEQRRRIVLNRRENGGERRVDARRVVGVRAGSGGIDAGEPLDAVRRARTACVHAIGAARAERGVARATLPDGGNDVTAIARGGMATHSTRISIEGLASLVALHRANSEEHEHETAEEDKEGADDEADAEQKRSTSTLGGLRNGTFGGIEGPGGRIAIVSNIAVLVAETTTDARAPTASESLCTQFAFSKRIAAFASRTESTRAFHR